MEKIKYRYYTYQINLIPIKPPAELGQTVRKLPCEEIETQISLDINGVNGELYPYKHRNIDESGENKSSQMSFRTVGGTE